MSETKPVVVLSVNAMWNVYNFRAQLIRDLVASGYRVVALAPFDAYVERVRALGCEVVEIQMDAKGTNPLGEMVLLWRYFRILRRLSPDAYLGFTVKPNIYGSLAARLLGVPTINNIAGLGTAFVRGGWLQRLVRLLYRIALSGSARVFFQNRDDLSLFVEGGVVAASKTALLPGSGVNLAHFTPSPRPALASTSPLRVLLVSRLLWDKGIGEFVEAVGRLKRDGVLIDACLLGFLDAKNPTAIGREQVASWVDRGLITYLGETDDVRPEIGRADVVALPSYREGTPRSLLEAAAMAKPLVATDVPGCREVVSDGVNGFLVPAKDPSALAAALRRMAEMDQPARLELGRASRLLVEKRFDERLVIEAYLDSIRVIARG